MKLENPETPIEFSSQLLSNPNTGRFDKIDHYYIIN